MSEIIIRNAIENDLAAIHRLIYELAVYEKEPDAVVTTPEQMLKDGFGERSFFEAFVAEHPEDGIVGIALFYFGYSTWKGKLCYLDDLVITERYRRKGIGMRLFDHLIRYAHEQEAGQLRWHVLDWNEPAIEFYKQIQAELDPTWVTCKLTKNQLTEWVNRT